MDRIISLLAALVGLIALGGAILVHVNGDVQRKELATEVAELRTAIGSGPIPGAAPSAVVASSSSSEPISSEASTPPSSLSEPLDAQAQISQLQERITELEAENRTQASALADAQAKLGLSVSPPLPMAPAVVTSAASSAPSSELPSTARTSSSASAASEVSAAGLSSSASSSALASSSPAESGPLADCIPTGTRFVGKPGDSFAICKTPIVVKIAAVSDGIATVAGVGPIEAGSFGDFPGKGCSVMVFSADATGFADLRVTCQ